MAQKQTEAKPESKEEQQKLAHKKSSSAEVLGRLVAAHPPRSGSDPSAEKKAPKVPKPRKKILLVDVDNTLRSIPDPNNESAGNTLNQDLLKAAKATIPTDFIIFTQRNKYMEFSTFGFDPNVMSTEDILQGVRDSFADLKDSEGKPIAVNINISSSMDPFVDSTRPFQYWATTAQGHAAFLGKVKELYRLKTALAEASGRTKEGREQKAKLQQEYREIRTAVYKEIVDDLLIIEPRNVQLLGFKTKKEIFEDGDILDIEGLGKKLSPRKKDAQYLSLRPYLAVEDQPPHVVLIDDVPENHKEIADAAIDHPDMPPVGFVHAVDAKDTARFRPQADYEFELDLNERFVGADPSVIEAAKKFAASIKAGIDNYEEKKANSVNPDKTSALEKMWRGILNGKSKEVTAAIDSTKEMRRGIGFGTTKLYRMLAGEGDYKKEGTKFADVHPSITKLTDLVAHAKLLQDLLQDVNQAMKADTVSEVSRNALEAKAVGLAAALEKYKDYQLSPMQLDILTRFHKTKPETYMLDASTAAFAAIGTRVASENKMKNEQKAVAQKQDKKMQAKEKKYEDSQNKRRTPSPVM